MIKSRIFILVLLFILNILLFVNNSPAQSVSSPNTLSQENSESMPPASIDDVSWITGHWQGEMFEGLGEEVWSAPSGKSMMGMYRHVKDGKLIFYEFLIITEESNSLTLKLKHFNPDLTGWEEKDIFVEFPLVKITQNEVYFDGITFRSIDNDHMDIFLRIKRGDAEVSEVASNMFRLVG